MIMALMEAGLREGLDGTVHEIFSEVAQMEEGVGAGLKLVVLMMEMEKLDGIGKAEDWI